MSLLLDVYTTEYRDDDFDHEDGETRLLVTLGPFERVNIGEREVTVDEFRVVAQTDGVNPGMWIAGAPSEHTQNGSGLVDWPTFEVRSA